MGGEEEEGGWPGLGVGMDFPLREREERTEGGGFPGKHRDESPRDQGQEWTGRIWRPSGAQGGRAVTMRNSQQWPEKSVWPQEAL